MSHRHPLVLFSGGLDSTYLLYCVLLREKQSANVVYLDGGQGDTKSSIENRQRQKIIDLLQVEIHEQNVEVTLQDVTSRNRLSSGTNFSQAGRCRNSGGLVQAAAWVVETLKCVDDETHVLVGYVPGDDGAFFWQDIKAAWDAMSQVVFRQRPVSVEAPLLDNWVKKYQMFDTLPKAILQELWMCELPINLNHYGEAVWHHCGKCAACRRCILERFHYYLEKGKFPPLPHNPGLIQVIETQISEMTHPNDYGYNGIADALGVPRDPPTRRPTDSELIDS